MCRDVAVAMAEQHLTGRQRHTGGQTVRQVDSPVSGKSGKTGTKRDIRL